MRRDQNPFKNRAKICQTRGRLPDTRIHGGPGADLLKSSLDDAELRALTPPPGSNIAAFARQMTLPLAPDIVFAPFSLLFFSISFIAAGRASAG
jgi:hypothetical protein